MTTATRMLGLILSFAAIGCTGTLEGPAPVDEPDDQTPPDDTLPPGEDLPEWSVDIDTSATDPFVPSTATTASIVGLARSGHGISRLTVAGAAVVPDADGRFEAQVAVRPGLQLIEIEAQDGASPAHSRQAHRSLLSADFLAEGEMNPGAAAVTLTEETLAAITAPLRTVVEGIDVASEIRSRAVLSEDDTCVTRPQDAGHGTPTFTLETSDAGEIVLEVVIPDLQVDFEGTCSVYIDVDIVGSFEMDVVIRTTIEAPPRRSCLEGLEHGPVDVELRDFELEVDGDSWLDSIMVSLFGEVSEGETADRLKAAFAEEADAMIGPALDDLVLFEQSLDMEMLGVPITIDLCATGLVSEGGSPRALVGARVRGPGGLEAPGAPLVSGDLPPAGQGGFWLDANLVGQLLLSAWRAGGLARDSLTTVELSTLALIAPELRDHYPEATTVDVSLDGRLPPLVRAAADGSGDLVVEIGDLDVILEVGGEMLYRVGTQLTMTLELEPADGSSLTPVVSDAEAVAWVLEEPVVDIEDAALAEAVRLQLTSMASALLDGAVIQLPQVGNALVPADASATDGGRYVVVTLR